MNRVAKVEWTDDRISRLRTMWRDGKSATEIAIELGGVSRNAVIGKIHRLDLHHIPGRAASVAAAGARRNAAAEARRKAKPEPAFRFKTVKKKPPAPSTAAPALRVKKVNLTPPKEKFKPSAKVIDINRPRSLDMRLFDLRSIDNPKGSDCRYITSGTGADARFCGHTTPAGRPYCDYHFKICCEPLPASKKGR